MYFIISYGSRYWSLANAISTVDQLQFRLVHASHVGAQVVAAFCAVLAERTLVRRLHAALAHMPVVVAAQQLAATRTRVHHFAGLVELDVGHVSAAERPAPPSLLPVERRLLHIRVAVRCGDKMQT